MADITSNVGRLNEQQTAPQSSPDPGLSNSMIAAGVKANATSDANQRAWDNAHPERVKALVKRLGPSGVPYEDRPENGGRFDKRGNRK